MEICLSLMELRRGFAYRSRARCERHYRVGDIRKAKDRQNCSLGSKVSITNIHFCRKANKTRISFRKINEHKVVHYINTAGE